RIVRTALDEDLGPQHLDVTSVATVPEDQTDTGDLVAREPGVVAGLAVAAAVFEACSGRPVMVYRAKDGERVARGDVVATVAGPTRGSPTCRCRSRSRAWRRRSRRSRRARRSCCATTCHPPRCGRWWRRSVDARSWRPPAA